MMMMIKTLQLDQTRYASAKEPVEEPIAKVVMDDAVNTVGEDVAHLEKKQTRLRLYTKSLEEYTTLRGDDVTFYCDGVMAYKGRHQDPADLKKP
ncbi:hypothetical protein Tco_0279647 [Tanacetum coccineum]